MKGRGERRDVEDWKGLGLRKKISDATTANERGYCQLNFCYCLKVLRIRIFNDIH